MIARRRPRQRKKLRSHRCEVEHIRGKLRARIWLPCDERTNVSSASSQTASWSSPHLSDRNTMRGHWLLASIKRKLAPAYYHVSVIAEIHSHRVMDYHSELWYLLGQYAT
ncbi:hypothetical protein CC79DRAFT_8129 [Sarocladium strictum]